MTKILLSINAGSSSVKVSVYRVPARGASPEQIIETQISGLTAPPATFSYQSRSQQIKHQKLEQDANSQDEAFKYILDYIIADKEGAPEIQRREDIVWACHRIVHGGDYDDAQVITPDTYHHLESLTDLAPLHNAPALSIVKSCLEQLPHTKNIACFDSAYHQTIPIHIRTYPIDPEVASKNKLRKYGFHGISYAFIVRSVAECLRKPINETNIIALHLGSGASACAIKNGRSLDTSMGLTPLAGLPGATRSGSIDPSLVFHFTSDAGRPSPNSTKDMHISTAEDILNKQSGWKALTGTTDFGAIASAATSSPSNPSDPSSDFPRKAKLAYDLFVDRIAGYIGSYFVSLNGEVDALVFAGGIGEKSTALRKSVVEKVRCLGFGMEDSKNKNSEELKNAEDGRAVVVDLSAQKEGGKRVMKWLDNVLNMPNSGNEKA
ncbi:MAG: hypothetical protein M1823_001736 [Watsoniomyces obsoletus]|nr:MAG: hypothetical protein M1823_001736 [Watsoniomyces obsoletus]